MREEATRRARRRPWRRVAGWVPALAAVAVLAASPRPAAAQKIVSIAITPNKASLAIDQVILLTAEATFSDGTSANVSEVVDWKTTNPGVARVSNRRGSKGRVTAKGTGNTTISVEDPVSGVTSGQSGKLSNCDVEVLGRLKSLTVTPASRTVPLGESRRMTCTGTFNTGASRDLTDVVSWASTNSGIVSVSNEPGNRGRITAISPGSADISATSSTGITSTETGGDGTVKVPASLVSVRVLPTTNRLPVSLSLSLTAEGSFNDGTTDDISDHVTWSSSDPSIATVSDADGSKGDVTAIRNGTVLVSVVDPDTGISSTAGGGDALVTVSGMLVRITLEAEAGRAPGTPAEVMLPTGLTSTFSATGTLDDGSTLSLSRRSLLWTSSNPPVATASNDAGTEGVVTAVSRGLAVISARHPATGVDTLDSGGNVNLTVLGRVVALAVRPKSRDLFTGQTERFSAVATTDDGGEVKLTHDLQFSSSDPSIAAISNRAGSRGDTTGVAKGTAAITVVHKPSGISSASSGNDGTVDVRGRVEALRVDPKKAFYVLGTQPKLKARATFDDGSADNIGSDVVWTSSDPSVADIGNKSPGKGVLTSNKVGKITVSAVEPVSSTSTTASGGDGVITIVDGLERLKVRDGALEMRTGDVIGVKALGTYPNPAPDPGEGNDVDVDVTDFVTLTSSNEAVVTVSDGQVTAVGLGEATVSARDPKTNISSSDSSGDAVFKVIAALTKLKITPRRVVIRTTSRRKRGFRAIGTYTDKARIELTDRVTFDTGDPTVAKVSNEKNLFGVVVPVGPGRTTATAVEHITKVQALRPGRIVVKGPHGRARK